MKFIQRFLIENKLLDSFKQVFNTDLTYESFVEYISKYLKLKCCEEKDVVFNMGEKAEDFYIILDGTVEVSKPQMKKVFLTQLGYLHHFFNLIKESQDFLVQYTLERNNEISDVIFYKEFLIIEKIILKIKLAEYFLNFNIYSDKFLKENIEKINSFILVNKSKSKFDDKNSYISIFPYSLIDFNGIVNNNENFKDLICKENLNSNKLNLNLNENVKEDLKILINNHNILEKDNHEKIDFIFQEEELIEKEKEKHILLTKFEKEGNKKLEEEILEENFKENNEKDEKINQKENYKNDKCERERDTNKDIDKFKNIEKHEQNNKLEKNENIIYPNIYSDLEKQNSFLFRILNKFNIIFNTKITLCEIQNLTKEKLKFFFEENKKFPKDINLDLESLPYDNKSKIFKNFIKKIILNKKEEEILIKFSYIFNDNITVKEYDIYYYKKFLELKKGNFFGDTSLDSKDKKRTLTVIAKEKTYLGILKLETYSKYIFNEKNYIRKKEIEALNSLKIFNAINYNIFEKNYFLNFNLNDFKKGDAINNFENFSDKLIILKEGLLNLVFTGSINDINNLIEKIINKCIEAKYIDKIEAIKKINKYCKEDKIYPDWINKKRDNLILQLYPYQICGIESLLLQSNLLYKAVVFSDKCKIYTLEKEKFYEITKDYKTANDEYMKFGRKKIEFLIKRLFDIKKTNLEMFEKRNINKIVFINDRRNEAVDKKKKRDFLKSFKSNIFEINETEYVRRLNNDIIDKNLENKNRIKGNSYSFNNQNQKVSISCNNIINNDNNIKNKKNNKNYNEDIDEFKILDKFSDKLSVKNMKGLDIYNTNNTNLTNILTYNNTYADCNYNSNIYNNLNIIDYGNLNTFTNINITNDGKIFIKGKSSECNFLTSCSNVNINNSLKPKNKNNNDIDNDKNLILENENYNYEKQKHIDRKLKIDKTKRNYSRKTKEKSKDKYKCQKNKYQKKSNLSFEIIEEIDNDFTNKVLKKTREVIFNKRKGKF